MGAIKLALINTAALILGQTLFKLGSSGKEISSLADIFQLMISPIILIAIFLYGCTTVLWVYILSRYPLSTVYPIQALAFPVVLIISSILFREHIEWIQYVGVCIICLGVFITTRV